MWPKHVLDLSVTFLQKSGSKQERPTLENKTGSGYKTLSMLFLWVSLKTSSCCKTWPFLVLWTKKEDPEEDPCGGWSLGDLPFHQGLKKIRTACVLPISVAVFCTCILVRTIAAGINQCLTTVVLRGS